MDQQEDVKVTEKLAARARAKDAGMTLIEVLIVLALISLIMGSVGVMVFNNFKKGQVKTARINVSEVANAAQQYMMDNSHECPQGLEALESGKYLKKNMKDPWGQPFTIKCPGEQDPDGVDVISKGPDKQEGSDDDINSWEL
jgi:general secretion pathway protein G